MADDRHVRRGQNEYAFALAALLPQGIAWPRALDTVIMRVVHGLAGILGFCDGRAADLLERESDPRQTIELLPDWERNFGLPDPCYQGPLSIDERQRHLVLRMTIEGGASRKFFIDFAAFIGYRITISEFRPFMVGIDRCGDNRVLYPDGTFGIWPCEIGPPEIRYAWRVNIHDRPLIWFRASAGQAAIDPHLRIALAEDLECVVRRWKPAHTEVVFDYTPLERPHDPMAGTP
jgi:uncharacterized protein YmfQ (DUF2313 family)